MHQTQPEAALKDHFSKNDVVGHKINETITLQDKSGQDLIRKPSTATHHRKHHSIIEEPKHSVKLKYAQQNTIKNLITNLSKITNQSKKRAGSLESKQQSI